MTYTLTPDSPRPEALAWLHHAPAVNVQAVLDAVISVAESPDAEAIAAAAIRAAVDQVLPVEPCPKARQLGIDYACWQRLETRNQLLAIAAGLKVTP
jgi:hypothetical protein